MKKFQFKIFIRIVVTVIVVCGSLLGLKGIGAISDYYNLGKQIGYNAEVENADTIIMKINGTPITREAFLN